MENNAYEVAKARAFALCREAAGDPIPVEDALAHQDAFYGEVSWVSLTEAEQEEFKVMLLVFEAIGTLQEIGAALGPTPEEPAPVVIHRAQAGAVVVPKPSNVR